MRHRENVKRRIKISSGRSDYANVFEERRRISFLKFWRKIGCICEVGSGMAVFFQDGALKSHQLSANRDNWTNEIYWIRRAYPPTHNSIFEIYQELLRYNIP